MCDERFARQYRCGPPPEFPLDSPCTSIVHHLSGPSKHAHTQTSLRWLVSCWCKDPNKYFRYAHWFPRLCTCMCVRLLGPCFKTGRVQKFGHRRVYMWEQCGTPAYPGANYRSLFKNIFPRINQRWLTIREKHCVRLVQYFPQHLHTVARTLGCTQQSHSVTQIALTFLSASSSTFNYLSKVLVHLPFIVLVCYRSQTCELL